VTAPKVNPPLASAVTDSPSGESITVAPSGFNRILEAAILPSTEKVLTAVKDILKY
jgi:hypothetical protein